MAENEALKPCPFCGSAARRITKGLSRGRVKCSDTPKGVANCRISSLTWPVETWNTRAALAAEKQEPAAVTPLKWEVYSPGADSQNGHTGRRIIERCRHAWGSYFVELGGSGWFLHFGFIGPELDGPLASLDDAKAAAQADFDRRIRSCLTTHPSSADEEIAAKRKAARPQMDRSQDASTGRTVDPTEKGGTP